MTHGAIKIDLKPMPETRRPGLIDLIEWPKFEGFKDGETIFINGEPHIYRKQPGQQATAEPIAPKG